MKQTNSEYQEARFKRGAARQIKENGQTVNKSVKIADIPQSAEMKMDKNSDLWLDGSPQGVHDIQLTFRDIVDLTTNSSIIRDNSLTAHQYTFDIYNIDNDKENQDINKQNKVTLSAEERREIYNKLSICICIEFVFGLYYII